MQKKYYNKLIRDRVPKNITAVGSSYQIKKLSGAAFEKALKNKLIEEAQEAAGSSSKEELVKELGDLLDVIEEIKRLKRIKAPQIKQEQKRALIKKGGFKKRLFLLWSSDDGYQKHQTPTRKR